MAQEYSSDIGRALGWDLVYYGWDPREDAPVDVIEGHTAGNAHFGSKRKHPTRFERKWLQLRQNALDIGASFTKRALPNTSSLCRRPSSELTGSQRPE